MSNPKKYYWLKLFDNFFADPKIKKLRKLAGGDTYIVILLKMMLQTVKNDGIYVYQGIENTLAKELELVIDENENHITAVLIYLEKIKLIEEVEYNHFLLTQVPLMLGSEGDSAERKRAQRAREKEKSGTLSRDGHVLVTQSHTEIEKEIEKELDERRDRENFGIKSFLDMKSFLVNNRKGLTGKQHEFLFENQKICISDKEIPYNMVSGQNLTFVDSDNFYKSMFRNIEYAISVIEQGA